MKNDIWTLTAPAPMEATAQDRPLPAETHSPLHAAKVMMVDDEPLMTDLIQTHLEEDGYSNFVVSNDPRRTLQLLRQEEPGVLLLDLMMPQMSGFEVLEAIRADRDLRFTPVIVLTAATGADAKLRALQLGATDFLSKPVDASELVLRVRNTLAFRQYHDRLLNFDLVTGLPNQRMFDRGLESALQRRDLVGGQVALLSITVPECRDLREGLSQAAADALARTLAHRLDRFAHERSSTSVHASHDASPRVARLGGEQFVVMLEGLADADDAEAAAQRLDGLAVARRSRSPPHGTCTRWWPAPGSVSRCRPATARPSRRCARAASSRPRTRKTRAGAATCSPRTRSMPSRWSV
jgi:diguanylate cyclase